MTVKSTNGLIAFSKLENMIHWFEYKWIQKPSLFRQTFRKHTGWYVLYTKIYGGKLFASIIKLHYSTAIKHRV